MSKVERISSYTNDQLRIRVDSIQKRRQELTHRREINEHDRVSLLTPWYWRGCTDLPWERVTMGLVLPFINSWSREIDGRFSQRIEVLDRVSQRLDAEIEERRLRLFSI